MKTARLLLLSLLFTLLLNDPLISIVNVQALLAGIPVLYLYVLLIWGLLIGALAYVIHQHPPTDKNASDDD